MLLSQLSNKATWLPPLSNDRNKPVEETVTQALEIVHKLAVKLVKGMRHAPYKAALQRWLFSLVHRRIRGELICMYKIMHGLLDFPHPLWASRSYFQDIPTAT